MQALHLARDFAQKKTLPRISSKKCLNKLIFTEFTQQHKASAQRDEHYANDKSILRYYK